MENSTTRISDLHDGGSASIQKEFHGNITAQPQYPQQQPIENGSVETTNYNPLNIHPNPYGHDAMSPENIPLQEPEPTRGPSNQFEQSGQISYTLENMPTQRLPSRDIPSNSVDYQQDNEVQANYVPKVKLTSDYIREYEVSNEQTHREHRENKYREETAHNVISDLQLPILVAVLYFIFQMPIINKLLRKYFTFMTIYNEDGNFNITGLILKSISFGSIFYAFNYISNAISRL
jgi:hypothetical protein